MINAYELAESLFKVDSDETCNVSLQVEIKFEQVEILKSKLVAIGTVKKFTLSPDKSKLVLSGDFLCFNLNNEERNGLSDV